MTEPVATLFEVTQNPSALVGVCLILASSLEPCLCLRPSLAFRHDGEHVVIVLENSTTIGWIS